MRVASQYIFMVRYLIKHRGIHTILRVLCTMVMFHPSVRIFHLRNYLLDLYVIIVVYTKNSDSQFVRYLSNMKHNLCADKPSFVSFIQNCLLYNNN